MKRINNLVILVLFLILAGSLVRNFSAEEKIGFRVEFFDVGQGDATYIRGDDNFEVLIDGGPDDTVLEKLAQTMSVGDKTLDAVVLTHPHSDHLAGLVKVLQKYEVKTIYFTDAVHTSDLYFDWLDAVKSENARVVTPRTGDNYIWGSSLQFKVFFPDESFDGKTVSELNNTSVVGQLIYQNKKILFTGDAEKEVQDKILAQKSDIKSDIYKIPHHGSQNGIDEAFIKAVNPQYAVIFAGKNNKFGHPSKIALDSLKKFNILTLSTKTNRNITFYSDGENWRYTVSTP